jgi:hypothetical protein
MDAFRSASGSSNNSTFLRNLEQCWLFNNNLGRQILRGRTKGNGNKRKITRFYNSRSDGPIKALFDKNLWDKNIFFHFILLMNFEQNCETYTVQKVAKKLQFKIIFLHVNIHIKNKFSFFSPLHFTPVVIRNSL